MPLLERERDVLVPSLEDPALSVTEQQKTAASSPAAAFHARCTHVAIALLRAQRRGDAPRQDAISDRRLDALLCRSFAAIEHLRMHAGASTAVTAWFDAVTWLPEPRRVNIYLSGTSRSWPYFARDPVAPLVRAAVRWVAKLPNDRDPPALDEDLLDAAPSYLAKLGPRALPELGEALATKGAKRREVLTKAVALIPGDASRALLRGLVKDRGKRVRELAVAALARPQGQRS